MAAFWALRSAIFNYALEETPEGKGYSVLVLAALLFGSEVWCFREDPLA